MNHYFENIRIVEPETKIDDVFNLWTKDGAIKFLSKNDAKLDNETKVINGKNLVAAPGFFDMHVHLREPGFEYKENIETGCAAAANGGFTGMVCMPNTMPVIDNLPAVEFIKNRAKNQLTDVFISASITQNLESEVLSPMLELSENGVVMFTDDGKCVVDTDMMRRAFLYAKTKSLLIAQHCEDHSLTGKFAINESELSEKLGLKGYPTVAEEIMISRDLALADYCGNARYHALHVSAKGSVRLIRDAKKRGVNITCEAAPHHFSLTEEYLETYDTNFKMNPPLRKKEDVEAIIEGLQDGTIDCIASDHAPHALHEKEVEFEIAPNGVIGLETSIGVGVTYLVKTNKLTLGELICKMSTAPRKILNLPAIKIAEGEPANLTIFAPDEEWVVNKDNFRSRSSNTPYNGMKLFGKPKYAINKNKIVESLL